MPSTPSCSARRNKPRLRARRSGCRTSSGTALRRPPPRRGFWIATPRSRCCTASRTVPWSATTRTSPGARATPSTPTGSATCAWCSTLNSSPATGTARCTRGPGCWRCWRACRRSSRPKLVRGDCAYGSEGEMSALEAIGQPYLFKLRQSAGVKKLVKRQWRRRDWCPVGQGWDACEDTLLLTGWSERRRVIVMRRVRKIDLLVEVKRPGRPKRKDQVQAELHFVDENEPVKSWEYAVLVCNTYFELQNIGQLYRDRADCENGFDEIKNQWGWGGYTLSLIHIS